MLIRSIILAQLILLLAPTAMADASDTAIIDSSHHHRFLSVHQVFPDHQRIHYEGCNASQGANGFHWKYAGFGVGAPNELQPGYCAIKQVYGFDSADPSPPTLVTFQDGNRGHIRSWIACDVYGPINTCGDGYLERGARLVSGLSFFSGYDETNIRMETISIELDIAPGSRQATIRVVTSSGFEHPVTLVFPMANVDVEEISNIVESDGEIEFQTFSYYRDNLAIDASLLAEDIPSSSPVIAIARDADYSGYDRSIQIADVSKLGRLIVALAAADKGIALRNDLPVPTSRQLEEETGGGQDKIDGDQEKIDDDQSKETNDDIS